MIDQILVVTIASIVLVLLCWVACLALREVPEDLEPAPKQEHTVNKRQLKMLQHATGFFSDSPGERNSYCAPVGTMYHQLWMQLCAMEYAEPGCVIDSGKSQYFHATPSGRALIGLPDQQYRTERAKEAKRRIALLFIQELVYRGAWDEKEVEEYGFTMQEVKDFEPEPID